MGLRRICTRLSTWRRWVCVVAVVVLGAGVRVPATLSARDTFPRASPAALAHLLADYSMHPHEGSWSVQEEAGNYSSWRYVVSFSCGARCAGEAHVRAAVAGEAPAQAPAHAPTHGHAPRHVVHLAQRTCSRPPLLPWPALYEEMEVEWSVFPAGAGGGCTVVSEARAACSVLRAASGACASELRARRERLHRRLLAALSAAPAPAA